VIKAVYINRTREGLYVLYFDAEHEIDIGLARISAVGESLPGMGDEFEEHEDAVRAGIQWLSHLCCDDTVPHDNFE
jgi:hypothetical protein